MTTANNTKVEKKRLKALEQDSKFAKPGVAGSDNIVRVLQQRYVIYNFLKKVYEKELSVELLLGMPQKMRSLVSLIDVGTDKKLQNAIKQLVEFTGSITKHNVSEKQLKLAADYARLFLSIHKTPPHPSESVYREGALMQSSRDEVMELYWDFGVDINSDFTEPEDHIAVELSFMALMCQKAIEEIKKGTIKTATGYIQTQGEFLEEHLLKWVPKLVADVCNSGKTPFYTSVAVITNDFLKMDFSICEDLITELKARRIN